MSAFGGDSWAREAQYRKRRLDDLLIDYAESSSYRKTRSGKCECLVCPNNPLLDSLLMLSMHVKGARHIAAESTLKERELWRQDEINKRIALNDHSASTVKLGPKPLIQQTKKTISNVQSCFDNERFRGGNSPLQNPNHLLSSDQKESPSSHKSASACNSTECQSKSSENNKMLVEWQIELRKRQERELKFTAAGWKRDCNGKWFKDENVEFDSDEEDPNICLT
ncbi:hypothetical protein QJS04_geneDACA018775 [Acorus gramineus]|uniref:Sodium channel modifier 1 n=1 Tax=Acorus gramineus TaxID=55184 RepID=A0AAV9BKV7_ACOGR|nr:hypothetical protein QJS04_geneDACA018775 [Acorus gramineus]